MENEVLELDAAEAESLFDGGWAADKLDDEQEAAEVSVTDADSGYTDGGEGYEGDAVQTSPASENVSEASGEAASPDFQSFIEEHPDLSAEDIPDEVWRSVAAGESLSGAWARYENGRLRARIVELEQESRNRRRSTGSRMTAGASKPYDPFEDGWQYE